MPSCRKNRNGQVSIGNAARCRTAAGIWSKRENAWKPPQFLDRDGRWRSTAWMQGQILGIRGSRSLSGRLLCDTRKPCYAMNGGIAFACRIPPGNFKRRSRRPGLPTL
ncbi:hypothetical protein QLX08_008021 [Tetragonisca angustula]|uniref:Uncharacterized protein n=1 Tax=Tetragonisca angustula TaxID=166442 RepID=A0AAW0ZNK8_9HYME